MPCVAIGSYGMSHLILDSGSSYSIDPVLPKIKPLCLIESSLISAKVKVRSYSFGLSTVVVECFEWPEHRSAQWLCFIACVWRQCQYNDTISFGQFQAFH